ncbi:MAG: DUF488 domain-containing protein [Cellulosilyticaceae bacterium]
MKKIVYTLGYAHHTQESFLELLKKYQINCVVDVRTMAYSKFHPQFNKEPLNIFLKQNGIVYVHMYKEFGIIRGETTLNNEDGYLDFNKLACLPIFKSGLERIHAGVEKGFTICFICAEKDPSDCHRSTLVGRELSKVGYKVNNIRYDGVIEEHSVLEERIIEEYCPSSHQIDLFQEEDLGYKRLEKAYRLCNNEIVEVNSKRVLKDEYTSPRKK